MSLIFVLTYILCLVKVNGFIHPDSFSSRDLHFKNQSFIWTSAWFINYIIIKTILFSDIKYTGQTFVII